MEKFPEDVQNALTITRGGDKNKKTKETLTQMLLIYQDEPLFYCTKKDNTKEYYKITYAVIRRDF